MIKFRIWYWLHQKCMTLKQLHELTGIRQATLSEMANNKRQSANFDNLYKIMDALELHSISEILTLQKQVR